MKKSLFTSLMPCINLLILIFCLFKNAFVGAVVDPYYLACVPRTCGNGQNISFPFYIKDVQKPYCGYPGFEVSCSENGQPILNLTNGVDYNYIIHEISYTKHSFRVSNSAFSSHSETGLCIPQIHNFSLPGERLELPKQDQVFLLYNCRPPRIPNYEIGCSKENETNWVLGLPENDKDQLGNLSRICGNGTVVAAPVKGFSHGNVGIREVLSRGFDLKWKAGNCNRCQDTGGFCGFNRTSYAPECYCRDRIHRIRCRSGDNGSKKLKFGLGFGLGVPFLFLIIFMLWRYKQRNASPKFLARSITDPYLNTDQEGGSVFFGVPVFSYTDLQKATNNFDSEKELGDGGFGTVYHGKLKDGREVAVKRLYQHNYKRVEQFKNEVEILTRLRHKNLVSLYGCTSRHSRELILVYEYIPNGTVADHLHGDRSQPSLPWSIRMSIAIETATALTYLHASDIVHRDVKTNNILLDKNFCVKVADFGLSRLFPTDVTHISTCPQGTPGYVDPEYHQCYQLTTKSDVYSFGVVLIELISSMPAVDITRQREEINLANLATNKIQKCEFHELIDQSIGFESDTEVRRMTIAVAALAFQCLQQNKEMRPSMDEVLEALKSIDKEVDRPENQEKEFDDFGVTESVQPTISPECDELGLLKNTRSPLSPISVTQKWPSTRSVTPNDSGKMI